MAKRKIGKQTARTERTRERLMTAAYKVFVRDGFQASRIEDIAALAGYTRGAFYANFEGKDDLFIAMFEQQSTTQIAKARAVLEKQENTSGWLAKMKELYLEQAADKQWALLNLEFRLYALRHPESQRRFAESLRKIMTHQQQVACDALPPRDAELPIQEASLGIAYSAFARAIILEGLFSPHDLAEEELKLVLGYFFDRMRGERREGSLTSIDNQV